MPNFTVGRIVGIPIRLDATLLLFVPLLVWLIATGIENYAPLVNAVSPIHVDVELLATGSTPWLIGATAAVGLFVGVLLHELGHSVVAMRYGIPIASITLWIFGGLARMEELPEDWDVEFWVALAGPAVSLGIAGVCYLLLYVVPESTSQVVVFLIAWLAVINLVLAVFNMLPAFPMDGGRVLRALLARNRPYAEATAIAAKVGQFFGVAMVVVAILPPGFNPILVLVGLFVYVAAGAESRVSALRELLAEVTARDLLREDPSSVAPDDSVVDLIDRMLRERRTGYPVVDESGEVVGLVALAALREVPDGERQSTRVRSVMIEAPPVVAPDAPAFSVLEALSSADVDRVVVAADGDLYGTLTSEDVLSYVEVLQGLGPRGRGSDAIPPDGYA